MYYLIQKKYRAAALQYKRMESVTRSPIYNHASESLSGVSTIRAYDTRDQAEAKNALVTNTNTSATFCMRTIERWLGIRLESIGNAIVLVAGLMGVASKGTGIYTGYIGIALIYGMRITGMLSWAVQSTTELSITMNSVERILHYVNDDDPEEPEGKKLVEPPSGWPNAGQIKFDRLSMRYREGLDLVLRGLTFTVEGGQRVGICGRTGAGKSSLLLALFRMVEPASGGIIVSTATSNRPVATLSSDAERCCHQIDGVDINQISLKNLRSRMSIIPQDPVLFSGDVKFNLDPLGAASEQELWTVLERVHLDAKIRSLEGGLEASVAEFGDSFSVGQRQLICMARALLRRSQVLLMDEATSSVDIDTECAPAHLPRASAPFACCCLRIQTDCVCTRSRKIQELVRVEFARQTILTIAHRLNTIIDYDRIVVIDAGQVAEMDTPHRLLADGDSRFSALVAETGADSEAKLRAMAAGQGTP